MFKVLVVKYYVNKLHVLWDKHLGILCKYELTRSVNSYSTRKQHFFLLNCTKFFIILFVKTLHRGGHDNKPIRRLRNVS
jgi:hypothetical protein